MNILQGGLRRALVVLPVVLAVGGVVAPSASAGTEVPLSSLEIASEPGACPVLGSHHWELPADQVDIWERENIVKVDASTADGTNYVRLELNAAGFAPLRVGT